MKRGASGDPPATDESNHAWIYRFSSRGSVSLVPLLQYNVTSMNLCRQPQRYERARPPKKIERVAVDETGTRPGSSSSEDDTRYATRRVPGARAMCRIAMTTSHLLFVDQGRRARSLESRRLIFGRVGTYEPLGPDVSHLVVGTDVTLLHAVTQHRLEHTRCP